MDGRRIILNPGENEIRLEGANAGKTDASLWLYIPNMTLKEVFSVVIDPENVNTIRFEYGDMMDEYVGYTRVSTIQDSGEEISVCLKRPPATSTVEVTDFVRS